MTYIIIGVLATIFLAVVVLLVRERINPNASKGKRGERAVAKILKRKISGKKYVINDLLFKTESEQSCQIDHIVINKYGIWVIETKNFVGSIYGEDNQYEWTQVLNENISNKLYNPVKQNATHIYHLSEYLQANGIFHSLVVFLPSADISNIRSKKVCTLGELPNIINRPNNISLSPEEMEDYYLLLTELRRCAKISKKEHIKNIIKMREQIENGICPRCGGKLVLRRGKYGDFYGCERFPKCRFKKKTN